MARIPNIRVVIPEGNATMAVVTDLDTGEPITNIASMRIDLDANRKPFALVEMKVHATVEYQGPADTVDIGAFMKKKPSNAVVIEAPESYRDIRIEGKVNER